MDSSKPFGDKAFLEHILEAIDSIQEYSRHLTYEDLIEKSMQSKMKRDAIVREFEIIGEASNNLTLDMRQRETDIKWTVVVGMRNKIIHEYFGIDYEVVWGTIHEDLPKLKESVQKLLSV